MGALFTYLLQVSCSIVAFLLVYQIFFRNRTFFNLNRLYLLAGLLLSFLIPLCEIPGKFQSYNRLLPYTPGENFQAEFVHFAVSKPFSHTSIDLIGIAGVVYFFGIIVFAIKFTLGAQRIMALKARSLKKNHAGISVYIHPSVPTFSFLGAIFSAPDPHQIEIEHERCHIQQKHWIDRLVLEAIGLVLWFNPVIRYYSRAVKEQHEFLADRAVVNNKVGVENYLNCLLRAAISNSHTPMTIYFHSRNIKNRIIMLTKKKSPSHVTPLYFVIIPVIALLLVAFQKRTLLSTGSDMKADRGSVQNIPDGSPIGKESIKETVGFGERFNRATKKIQKHTGIDFLTDEGIKVMATADGVVVNVDFNDYKGNFVVIRHSDQYVTQYYHLLSASVRKGTSIRKGDVIGLVGSTGSFSAGNHLHYEVLKDNEAVDPVNFLPAEVAALLK